MVEQRVERRLAAILAGDVAGYSRLMGADEEGTLARLNAHRREFLEPTIAAHRGRIVKRTGDGILIEFASAVERFAEAMNCAKQAIEFNPNFPDSYWTLTAAAAHLGQINEAQAALERFVRLLPGLKLGDPRLIRPFRRPADRERVLSGLRKAGLLD